MGEKERYTHLNAEFQGIARRDKKAFLSDQCKKIEENNRMGKTRDHWRYQENISCKDGLNKGQKWYVNIKSSSIEAKHEIFSHIVFQTSFRHLQLLVLHRLQRDY